MESRKILKEEYLEIFDSFPLRGIINVCNLDMEKILRSKVSINNLLGIYKDEGLKIVSTSLYNFNNIVNIYTGFDNIENFKATNLYDKNSELYKCIMNNKYFNLDKAKVTTKTAWERQRFKDERLKICTQFEYKFYFITNLYSDFTDMSEVISSTQSTPSVSSTPSTSSGRKRKTIPKGIRDSVWERDSGRNYDGICFCCTKSVSCNKWECGHIISDADGGLPIMENLKVLCQSCNRSMGRMNLYEYKDIYYPE